MKIVIDVNLSPQWTATLNGAGFAALHWSTIGSVSAPDRAIWDWALANEAAILTQDLDFSHLLAATGAKGPSVAQLRFDRLSAVAHAAIVIAGLTSARRDLLGGALVTIDSASVRIRRLPFA